MSLAFIFVGVLALVTTSQGADERPQYSNCAVPEGWEDDLVVAPSPRNNFIRHSETAVVMCKKMGYTFLNDIYDIQGVYTSSVFFDSSVTITCKYGAFSPDVFSGVSSWCGRGCPKVPPDAYSVEYGNESDANSYLLQTDGDKAPVYPQPMQLVKLSCNAGYSQIYGDNGYSYVRCNEGGYDRIPIYCVVGCAYPGLTDAGSSSAHTYDPDPEITSSTDPTYSIGSIVTVNCNGKSSSGYEAVITCTSGYGWDGGSDWESLTCKSTTSSTTTSSSSSSSDSSNTTDSTSSTDSAARSAGPDFLLMFAYCSIVCVMSNFYIFK